VTVLEVIQRSTDFLSKKGIDSPRLQTELLLAHILALPRMQLYLKFERVLSDREVELMRDAVKRRAQHEPLQYIVGSTSFCGLEIKINRNVLVPRPETEMLAEQGWSFLKELVASGELRPKAVDLGTGSGCIAIALAVNCPEAEVAVIDSSPEALNLAKENAEAHRVSAPISFASLDLLSDPLPKGPFHLLISNPPYIPSAEIDSLQPEVSQFEPRTALDGGPDGLNFYRVLARQGQTILGSNGKLMVEFGDGQAEAISALLCEENWIVERVLEDYTRRPRILIARSHGKSID